MLPLPAEAYLQDAKAATGSMVVGWHDGNDRVLKGHLGTASLPLRAAESLRHSARDLSECAASHTRPVASEGQVRLTVSAETV